MHRPERHDLVWLTAEGWDQALADLADGAASGVASLVAASWRARDLPLVVRRTEPHAPAGSICLGLPAPPDAATGQKIRVAFTVPRSQIATLRPALLLDEIRVPAHWSASWRGLADDLRAASVACRVFGSVAMQTLTGEDYLAAASDIDLLLRPRSTAQLDAGVSLLARHAQALPLDGEIVFPDGHAVNWKEWHALDAQGGHAGARVLAKHIDAVALVPARTLLQQLHGERC